MRVRGVPRVCVALWCVAVGAAIVPQRIAAQQKTRLTSFSDWLRAGQALRGESGPEDVNWIEGGARYSYIVHDPQTGQEAIHAADPMTGGDTVLFSAQGLTFPGTTEPFDYESFQWAKDSRHLVFQTHFKPIYRNSGTADYFVYTLSDHSLQLAASGARTAELSPNGLMLGYERDGDMYVRISPGSSRRGSRPMPRRTSTTATSIGCTRKSSASCRRGIGRPTAGTSRTGKWMRARSRSSD